MRDGPVPQERNPTPASPSLLAPRPDVAVKSLSAISPLYKLALKLLGRRAHSRRQLRDKLLKRSRSTGEPAAEIDRLLDRLEEEGYLDDQDYALQRAEETRRRKHWGDLRIESDLRKAGISARIAALVLVRLEEFHPQELSLQEELADRIEGSGAALDRVEMKRLFDRCIRLGYPRSLVRQALFRRRNR